jgi:hypothetical protein
MAVVIGPNATAVYLGFFVSQSGPT